MIFNVFFFSFQIMFKINCLNFFTKTLNSLLKYEIFVVLVAAVSLTGKNTESEYRHNLMRYYGKSSVGHPVGIVFKFSGAYYPLYTFTSAPSGSLTENVRSFPSLAVYIRPGLTPHNRGTLL